MAKTSPVSLISNARNESRWVSRTPFMYRLSFPIPDEREPRIVSKNGSEREEERKEEREEEGEDEREESR